MATGGPAALDTGAKPMGSGSPRTRATLPGGEGGDQAHGDVPGQRSQNVEAGLTHHRGQNREHPGRRQPHDPVDDPVEHVVDRLQHIDERPHPIAAERVHGDAEQDGEEQDLEDLGFGERSHDVRGNDAHQDVHDGARLTGGGAGGLIRSAERRNVHPPAGSEPHRDPNAERQRHRQGAQVVDDRPNADPARALASGPREGERERDEDQGGDDHAEQPHEQIGDRLQHDGRLPEEHPDEHTPHGSHDDLNVKRH